MCGGVCLFVLFSISQSIIYVLCSILNFTLLAYTLIVLNFQVRLFFAAEQMLNFSPEVVAMSGDSLFFSLTQFWRFTGMNIIMLTQNGIIIARKNKAVNHRDSEEHKMLTQIQRKQQSSLQQPSVLNCTDTDSSKAAVSCCLCLSWNRRLEHILLLQVLVREQTTFIILSTENGFIAEEVWKYQLSWYHIS